MRLEVHRTHNYRCNRFSFFFDEKMNFSKTKRLFCSVFPSDSDETKLFQGQTFDSKDHLGSFWKFLVIFVKSKKGYIDVDDGRWRPDELVTSLRCWRVTYAESPMVINGDRFKMLVTD